MGRRGVTILSLLLWVLASGVAVATTPPAKVVQQFIEDHLRGRFAEARSLTLEQVDLRDSLFSSWLFGSGIRSNAGTADLFLSRKFTQAFHYSIMGTTPNGDNQVYVTVKRISPNLIHLYSWALAPKRAATPYALIEAIDTYLTKVNFPIEESRMQFTLIREVDEWYISAVQDEKFIQFQRQLLGQQPLGVASSPGLPLLPGGAALPSATTTTSDDLGRQIADAQFNATLQSFNRTYPTPTVHGASQEGAKARKPSLLTKVARLFGLGGKGEALPALSGQGLKKTFNSIRDALARYAAGNNGFVPDRSEIYDWQSFRRLVNRYSKRPLPATEEAAGFSFVYYTTDTGREDYTLLFELHRPQDGLKRVEVTPYGINRAS